MYGKLVAASSYIQSVKQTGAKIGILLGAAFDPFLKLLDSKTVIPYSEIPHFAETSDRGQSGQLILGKLSGIEVVVLHGRLHLYEGRDIEDVVFPIRTLSTLGIKSLIITNSAGGIRDDYRLGDLVMISDHINLSGGNPLEGPQVLDLGGRFPDMTQLYPSFFRQAFLETAHEMGYPLKEGVYCNVRGPTYETVAEVQMMKILGADLVGMSLVPEVVSAAHLGIKVAAISCITNVTKINARISLHQQKSEEEVQKIVQKFGELIRMAVLKIEGKDYDNSSAD